ncbi:FAD-dependent oxidoreductase [Mycobacterium sp. CBMA293]|uniref:FAD-dependent monooxygenase n=1 Tax=unclassified Mycolicibacterium TaxID=2636767 RepID=UPI0012DEB40D|nr:MULTISPECIES: FAD-dependent monooxygenase [unclassified Mycolicibacterium]MUL48300.1 FAD-dependent oxidoreductase [Mycolicibacterium sp. CBMA 360]MUL57533.1 FAD-dependent oxidoreductase [Mycolicibacterium sp. CBMA 335]MUL70573.1 FAD-dependent oxidoreductase [Mycolicibacterium sp. CBMA 311]MUL92621.1 FAD-dependent oxidoreductase [Mycolicibacterium sp. CBMA 230]MUM04998.1 FAD-dependent oxidoreductase [Mycolicibacterium sp. CBMA 213]
MTSMTDVVISGAGPNGLMLACELALAGVQSVVLEKLPAPSAELKANGFVGQVIRQLDMRGLYSVLSGQTDPPEPAYEWMFAGLPLHFGGLADKPMYHLRVPQPRMVEILERRARELGVEIRWGHELIGLIDTGDQVVLSVATADGEYQLETSYLVGADGGRSIVRKQSGIDFPGHTAGTVSRVAHVHLPEQIRVVDRGLEIAGYGHIPFRHNRLDRGVVMVMMMEPTRPMIGTIEYGHTPGSVEGEMSVAELRGSLQRILGVDVPVEEPRWEGPKANLRIDGQNTRQADRYRVGRILLVGDAAHVHSPLGGPGLNLGMSDAFNLGWKLAAEVNGTAAPGLLDTYESERHPVGQRVMMQSQSQIAMMSPGPEITALRELFGELLQIPGVVEHMGNLLAGSDVRYDVGDDHALSGRLVCDLSLDDGRRVAELLHTARPVLLDLAGGAAAPVAQDWRDRVDVVDGTMAGGPAAMLIRPDGYVAWAADTFADADANRLTAQLHRWVG